MRIVLFDYDTFEPITVCNILDWDALGIPEGSPINVPIMPHTRPISNEKYVPSFDHRINFITIRFERFYRRFDDYRPSIRTWFAFTNDPQQALLLKAAFLPGQRWETQEISREAFANGFINGLMLARRA